MCDKMDLLRLRCEKIINESWGNADGYLDDFKRISNHGIKTKQDKYLARAASALVVQQMIYNHAQNQIVGLSLSENEGDKIEDEIEDEIV